MAAVRYVLDCFWTPKVWLPPNVTWEDLVPNEKIQYTDHTHLYYPIPMAMVVLAIRYILETYVYSPFGVSLGIKSSKPKRAPQYDELLEKAYQENSKMSHKEVMQIAKQTNLNERQIERWLRLRRSQGKPSTLVKFCENGWKCTYYIFSFTYGLWCLWDKLWLWNIDECWTNYPHQSIDNDVWWYYMISLSFYWSLTASQFWDVKRKDFWQMFIHHIATIALLSFSWVCNLCRIGTLVLLVHDCADIFLEGAKMAKYAKYQKLCDAIFGVFTLLWLITRIGIYPVWILYSTTIKAPQIVNTMFPAYYIFNGLLLLLLLLHLFWTHLILKIAYIALMSGQMEGDIRSSSSDDLSDASTNSANLAGKTKTN
ncbi:longevity assurance factor [Nesidiocoris tenuis]|uniref:Longevity assurance factor n=1 Tax=Nesidiocoris tenuis TaxID=355587 RepID=A0ABN7AN44_9HEMI|nr:longevity assurance factor [Nesidiocoris tenuis]